MSLQFYLHSLNKECSLIIESFQDYNETRLIGQNHEKTQFAVHTYIGFVSPVRIQSTELFRRTRKVNLLNPLKKQGEFLQQLHRDGCIVRKIAEHVFSEVLLKNTANRIKLLVRSVLWLCVKTTIWYEIKFF